MNSHMTRRFRELLAALPEHIRQQADEAYALFRDNPAHPGLRFKHVNPGPPPIHSARVGIGHRAPGTVEGNEVVWFWIGSHAEYDLLLKTL